MKETGIIRKMDRLGRIVVPSAIRAMYHMDPGDAVEFYTNAGTVVLANAKLGDRVAESVNDLRETVNNCGDSLPAALRDGLCSHLMAMEKLVDGLRTAEN